MKYRFTTIITKEDSWFVARAVELGIVSQGRTAASAKKNLKEAVELYLEEAPAPKYLFARRAPVITTLEVTYA